MSASSKSKASWQSGTVHWFDSKSGEGMIRSPDGAIYYVNSTAIEDFANAKNKGLKAKQEVKFQLIEDSTFVQVSRVKEA